MPCISKVNGIISIAHYLLAQATESLTGMSVIKVIRTAYIIRYQKQCPEASPGISCILRIKRTNGFHRRLSRCRSEAAHTPATDTGFLRSDPQKSTLRNPVSVLEVVSL